MENHSLSLGIDQHAGEVSGEIANLRLCLQTLARTAVTIHSATNRPEFLHNAMVAYGLIGRLDVAEVRLEQLETQGPQALAQLILAKPEEQSPRLEGRE